MDISPIGTIGELVRYVTDYLSKSEPEGYYQEISIIQQAKDEGFRGKFSFLLKITRMMENARIVSIQEAIFLLLHLPQAFKLKNSIYYF